MIQEFHAENYRCLKKVSVRLTPLHAFIGPNDSGKSTLLAAVRHLVHMAAKRPLQGADNLPHNTPGGLSLQARFADRFGVAWQEPENELTYYPASPIDTPKTGRSFLTDAGTARVKELLGVSLLRLDPDELRKPSGLIPESQPLTFSERGLGLPGVYDAILGRDIDGFLRINAEVRRLFPMIQAVRVKAVSDREKALEAELKDGTRVGAAGMSEGLLYYLAFAAIEHLDRVSVLLIEEPENGLYPSRIADVMRILRAITEKGTTQILIATHSPLVINELKPEEVTVVTRPSVEEGTRLTPLQDTPHFAERSQVYALGELWLSYANGLDEAPLLSSRREEP